MTSKKLGALLRSVPPATAAPSVDVVPNAPPQAVDLANVIPRSAAPVANQRTAHAHRTVPPAAVEPEVPLHVLIPENVRRQLAILAAEQGESLRALVLQAFRGLGLEVSDADIKGKRGRKNL